MHGVDGMQARAGRVRQEKPDDAGAKSCMKGRWASNAQTDRCQMRGHGAEEGQILVGGLEIRNLLFERMAFYDD